MRGSSVGISQPCLISFPFAARRIIQRPPSMSDPRGMMTTANAAYEQLNTRFKKISAIGDARGILGWDMLTIMPKGASEARGEAVATLDAISHEALTDPRVGDWLNEAEGNPPADPDHQVNLAEMRRLYAHASAVEPALVEALSRAGSRCSRSSQSLSILACLPAFPGAFLGHVRTEESSGHLGRPVQRRSCRIDAAFWRVGLV